ncbi:hypothetical protein SLS56_004042 [Neofusicoccum ribis]|uniref:Cytochrome P450 n=1 Tax=Neofusicoccum ribis TaxID=45134 RepID=A0ABR3SY23_9PEZI
MTLEPIPQPPTHLYGMLANLPEIDPSFPLSSFWRLQALYGPIFQLDLISRKVIVLSSYELAHKIMDDEKFEKVITAGLMELRPLIKDGLFSAFPHEPASSINSNPIRQAANAKTELVEGTPDAHARIWTNGLAFDTIGICAFNYRFNNFYAEHMHPFATQMAAALIESGKRANRTQMETKLRIWSNKQLQDNIHEMHKLCDDLVAERKANPQPGVNDLLNTMLNVADPVTGEKLDDENIRYQMVTFPIAGHETTSGTLSYLFYNLLKNPEKLHKAQQEVDSVLGDEPITVKHLKYIDACIKETLRLNGPIGQISRKAKHDTVIGGRYQIPADHAIVTNLRGLHSDPAVWGEDAAEFRPERMLHMEDLPPDAWKPFGVGMRSCIGRAFAEQEMILNVALILQRFQVEMADPSYVLVNKSTLTIKPDGFFIKARRRPGKAPMVGLADLGATAKPAPADAARSGVSAGAPRRKMTVPYGSNAGTCKAFAEELQTGAPGFGFEAEVLTLDQATEHVPRERPVVVVVVTSSYEGKPPDNAAKFVAWLQSGAPELAGVRYAVFGVGNSEWAATYQRIPKLVDGCIARSGGERLVESCWADVKQDCTNEWENWSERLWQQLVDSGGAGAQARVPELKAEVIKHDMPAILGGREMSWAVVKSARSLGGREVGLEKREVEIELPQGVHYEAGDYFVVLPSNPPQTVARVLSRFGLHPDDLISISDTRKTFLQSKEPISAQMFFSHRVELNTPPTQRQLAAIIAATESAEERRSLESLADPSTYRTNVLLPNYSTLDILEDHPSTTLPLPTYLDTLKPPSPRQYSISSSPLAPHRFDPARTTHSLTLTYAVHTSPSRSAPSVRTFLGAASTYLASLRPGARLHGRVRRTAAPSFRLPADPAVPVVLVAAGSGIAPMRGFVEERVALAAAGRALGPALLYFGCRDYERDFICEEELRAAEAGGAVCV